MPLKLITHAFANETPIPDVHSKKGGNVSPPLEWAGVPEETISLALIVDDPDAPKGLFTHWIVYGLKPNTTGLAEHQPATPELPNGARQGVNGFGESGYGGPQPPDGTHRYVFHLYALDTETDIPAGLTRQEISGVIEGHVIEEATMMGRYTNSEKTRAA
jgi:Raf kinase inhibitor-like YbhB/YbcL family protein